MSSTYQTLEEASPVIENEVQVEIVDKPTPFSASVKSVIGVGGLVSLVALACLSYQKTTTMAGMADFKNSGKKKEPLAVFQSDDVALCENTFIYGASPRTGAEGCVVLSRHDLFGSNDKEIAMPTQTVCLASHGKNNGRIMVDYEMMKQMGFIGNDPDTEDNNKSILSGVSPGSNVDVTIFTGKNFDGESTIVNVAPIDGTLPATYFPSGLPSNDNVYSFIIDAKPEHFFAGKDCSQKVQICQGFILGTDAMIEPPAGCFLLTTTDPTQKLDRYTRGVRFCSNRDAGQVNIDYMGMTALGLVHRNGDKKSLVSYLKKGEKVVVEYYSSRYMTGDSSRHTGVLTHSRFSGSTRFIRDNVYSVMFMSTHWTVPKVCEIGPGEAPELVSDELKSIGPV